MQKNVASQKWIVFAFDRTDNTPKTGDAANISAKIKIDWGTANATNDVAPTETEDGFYEFDLTQAETNGDVLQILPESSTGDVQVIGVPGVITTTPANYSALGIESDGDLTKVNLCATTTANTDMRGTDSAALASTLSSLVGSPDVDLATDIGANLAAILAVPTATEIWHHLTSAITTVGSIGRLLKDSIDATLSDIENYAASIDGNVGTNGANLTDLGGMSTAMKAEVNAEADTALTDYAPATAASLTTAQNDLDVITGSDGVTLATAQANYAPATATAMTTAQNDLDTITGTGGVLIGTDAMTEAYAADGAAASLPQLAYMIWSHIHDFGISGTTYTSRKLDNSTAMTHTLDDASNPTDKTRAT